MQRSIQLLGLTDALIKAASTPGATPGYSDHITQVMDGYLAYMRKKYNTTLDPHGAEGHPFATQHWYQQNPVPNSEMERYALLRMALARYVKAQENNAQDAYYKAISHPNPSGWLNRLKTFVTHGALPFSDNYYSYDENNPKHVAAKKRMEGLKAAQSELIRRYGRPDQYWKLGYGYNITKELPAQYREKYENGDQATKDSILIDDTRAMLEKMKQKAR